MDSYYDVKGNSGDPEMDECKRDSNKEHRIGQTYPGEFDFTTSPTTSCDRCGEDINCAYQVYEACIKCGMEFCTPCGNIVVNGHESNILPFIMLGDFPVLIIISSIARLLCNKLYRDTLLSVYYFYKSKYKK